MSVEIGKIQKITSPNPFCLISSQRPDGGTNLMALSWWCYVSNKPAAVCIAISERGYTHELIEESGEFAINVIGENLSEKAFKCGTCSGRSVDKQREFEIAIKDATVISGSVVDGCCAVIECSVKETLHVNDHWLIVGDVVATSADPSIPAVFAMDGYSNLGTISK